MGLWPLAGAVVLWLVLWGAPVGPGTRRLLAVFVWVGALGLAHDELNRRFFARFDIDLAANAEVLSGNEFRLRSPSFPVVTRRYVLADTRLPEEATARERVRAAFAQRLAEGKVRLEIAPGARGAPQPWRAHVRRGEVDLGALLVAEGLLLADEGAAFASAPTPRAAAQPPPMTVPRAGAHAAGGDRPWWERDRPRARWIAWAGLVALGVLGVGLLRNAVAFGGGLALAVVATALYDLWRAQRVGEPLAPPLVALALVALLGGWCAVRLRPVAEALREEPRG
jgi:hypothetical protein